MPSEELAAAEQRDSAPGEVTLVFGPGESLATYTADLKEAAPKVAAASRILHAASPRERRRMWNMTIREVLAEARAAALPPGVPGAASRPREHRARRSQRSASRGDPDPESDPPQVGVPLAREAVAFPREGTDGAGVSGSTLAVAARAEAQRILDAAARRLQDAGLEDQALDTTAGSDADALENGADERTALVEREQFPVPIDLDDEGGVVRG